MDNVLIVLCKLPFAVMICKNNILVLLFCYADLHFLSQCCVNLYQLIKVRTQAEMLTENS